MTNKPASAAEISVGEWLGCARRTLQRRKPGAFLLDGIQGDESADRETMLAAQVLLAHVLGKTRTWVLAHPEAILDPNQLSRLNDFFEKLCLGMPLPYLTGKQEFFGLDFEVNRSVLIPRPETELLVERALAWLDSHPDCQRAADIGTGSGCIAVSLAARVPYLRWLAVDCSWKALQVARRNVLQHGVSDRVQLLNADLLSPCAGPFNLACANLPYIPHDILKTLPLLKYEPVQALDGGEDGLDLIRSLLASAQRWLAPGGLILLEMQFDQGDKIASIAKNYLPNARVTILDDLAGSPRLVEIQNGDND
ncbi:MAG: peptide chain release factor N(5)-glutamine methyltransferase [Anaerolineaceae bacterium]|nr:peptide chain release factor N(5)-glutamine methyltransferase [Anaerolineaceae bacterium]